MVEIIVQLTFTNSIEISQDSNIYYILSNLCLNTNFTNIFKVKYSYCLVKSKIQLIAITNIMKSAFFTNIYIQLRIFRMNVMELIKKSEISCNYEIGISLIIPAYHEKSRIMKSLDKYIPILESTEMKYEIIVVIDGNDGTENLLKGIKNLSYYKPVRRLGKGGAVKKGFSLAKYSYIGYVDADGSLTSTDFENILSSMKSSCCTIASRYLNNSKWINKEPLFNRISSRGFNFLVNAFFHLNVKDTQCGAKFFNKKVIDRILPAISVRNRTFDVAILYHVKMAGYRINEIPVTWSHDSNSNMPIKAAIIPMFLTIVAIKLMNSRIKEYVPKFLYKIVSKFNFY